MIVIAFYVGNRYPFMVYPIILLSLMISFGFLYQDYVKNDIGAFGSKVYWNRKLHSFLFFLFALCMYFVPNYAYFLLIIDLIYGISTIFIHYYI